MSIIVNRNIIFSDSLQFLKPSLDNLALNSLSEFPEDKLELLRKKDSYPYEWVDSYRKLHYPR